jgi:hypothetical protein
MYKKVGMEIIGEIGSTEPTQSVRQLDWSQNLDLFIGLGRLAQVQEQFKLEAKAEVCPRWKM